MDAAYPSPSSTNLQNLHRPPALILHPMPDLLAARSQMAVSLAFHIVFAVIVIGMPFSLEGFAFFTEAIFLGIYLYGWDRISSRAHLWAGVAVAVSGAASGVFVVIANAWMNAPAGFELVNGQAVNVDPIAAMANAAAVSQTLHMTLASYAATGFAVAGIHAFLLLRDPANAFHRRAL